MHPVTYLFDDIYRNHWGIEPTEKRVQSRKARRLRQRIFATDAPRIRNGH